MTVGANQGPFVVGTVSQQALPARVGRKLLIIQCRAGSAYASFSGVATILDGLEFTPGTTMVLDNAVPDNALQVVAAAGQAKLVIIEG